MSWKVSHKREPVRGHRGTQKVRYQHSRHSPKPCQERGCAHCLTGPRVRRQDVEAAQNQGSEDPESSLGAGVY